MSDVVRHLRLGNRVDPCELVAVAEEMDVAGFPELAEALVGLANELTGRPQQQPLSGANGEPVPARTCVRAFAIVPALTGAWVLIVALFY